MISGSGPRRFSEQVHDSLAQARLQVTATMLGTGLSSQG